MELVLVTHGGRAAFEIAHGGTLVGDDQGSLELPGGGGVDPEIGGQLHRAADPLRDVGEGAVAEDRGVEGGEEIVGVGDHGAEVPLHEGGMLQDRLREGAEDDAQIGEFLLEGGRHRDAVKDGVHGDSGEHLLFGERDPQLLVGLQQLRVDLVEALRSVLPAWSGVVDDVLVIDGGVGDVGPVRLLHGELFGNIRGR